MSAKSRAMLNFIPVALKYNSRLLKTLFHFVNERLADDVVEKHLGGKALPWVDLLDVVPDFNEHLTSLTFLDMTSRINDIAFIMALAKRFPACNYLEIGSWRGESLLNIMKYTGNSVSVSLSQQEMRDLNFSQEAIDADGFFLKNAANLKRVLHNSMTFDFSTLNQKFDLIFVDGDHSYEAVKSDTINAFKLLKDENSIIVWHDFGNNYSDQRNEVIAGVLDATTPEQQKNIYRVTNTLCGVYVKGGLKTITRENNYIPDNVFEVTVKGKKL